MSKFVEAEVPVLLFLHIPKTAGRTLTQGVLFRQYRTDDYYEGENGWLASGIYYYPAGLHKVNDVTPDVARALGRGDIRAVLGHFSFGIHQHLSRPFTYTALLRDPVERTISLYYHVREWDTTSWHEEVVASDLSLERLVTERQLTEFDNDQTRRIAGLEPPFGRGSRALLDTAKDNLRRYFAVVGTTERFDETLLLLKRKLGWLSLPSYQPTGIGTIRPKAEALPRETLDFIDAHNELDAELWRFAGELLDQQLRSQDDSLHVELDRLRTSNLELASRQRE